MGVILLNLIKQQQQGQGQSGQAKTLLAAGIAKVRAWAALKRICLSEVIKYFIASPISPLSR